MKYNVGDKVRVRRDLESRKYEGTPYGDSVTKEMLAFRGKTVTIKECFQKYYLEEDNQRWYWVDGMFEDEAVLPSQDKEKYSIKFKKGIKRMVVNKK